MAKYRKKPVEVEAWQVGSDEHMPEWVESSGTKPNPWQGYNAYFVKEGNNVVILSAYMFEQTYEVIS